MEKRNKYVVPYLSRDPFRDEGFSADCLTLFRILKIIIVGLKMDSGNAIGNCYILLKFSDFNPFSSLNGVLTYTL